MGSVNLGVRKVVDDEKMFTEEDVAFLQKTLQALTISSNSAMLVLNTVPAFLTHSLRFQQIVETKGSTTNALLIPL
jgi:hypothetical protein